jgi:hypothetical protein
LSFSFLGIAVGLIGPGLRPIKSKMPPFGGGGTIPTSRRNVNKTKACGCLTGADSAPPKNRAAGLAKMQLSDSKLGKTAKTIRHDSGDSCHGVTLPVG